MESRPGISDSTYVRIREACCEFHGLGKGRTFRNDPRELDEHAALITAKVLEARAKAEKRPAA